MLLAAFTIKLPLIALTTAGVILLCVAHALVTKDRGSAVGGAIAAAFVLVVGVVLGSLFSGL